MLRQAVGAAAHGARDLLNEKIDVAEIGLAAASGIVVDAIAEAESIVTGEQLECRVLVWNAGEQPIDVESIGVESAAGWLVEAEDRTMSLEAGKLEEWAFSARLGSAAEPTAPYFLRRSLQGDLYDWSAVDSGLMGEPMEPPPMILSCCLR